MPGALKNALDWLSRPPSKIAEVFSGKPFAMMGVSTGGFGTANAQTNFLPVLRFLKVDLWLGAMPYVVPLAFQKFDDSGELVNADDLEKLKGFLQGYSEFVNRK